MKSGVIVAIAVVVLLAVVGGYFYFSQLPDEGTVCTQDAQLCPDASYVGRNPNNNCEFFACPETNNSQNNSGQSQAQTLSIDISGFAFSPSTLEINVGDTIVWTNKDSARHIVSSDSGGELNSPYLSKGNSYSHTFTAAGTYAYHCISHPQMKGTVIVK